MKLALLETVPSSAGKGSGVGVPEFSKVPRGISPRDGARVQDEAPVVLVIDDSLVARRYLEKVLLDSGISRRVLLADSAESGIRLLRRAAVDLILCDVNMQGLGGFEFLKLAAADRKLCQIPVIMLTAEQELESKVDCLASGASDYLTKPFAASELIARARIHLQLKSLRDELQRKNKQLSELARLDPLMGISNRRDFFQSLGRELNRAQREKRPLSVAMVDVDHFKEVNDRHGHIGGDRALVEVAKRLRGALRDYDLLGRYGGEEFAIACIDTGAEEALRIAERCRRRVADHPLDVGGIDCSLTVSVGIATAWSVNSDTLTDLVSNADSALYRAKALGRNRVVLFSQEWCNDRVHG